MVKSVCENHLRESFIMLNEKAFANKQKGLSFCVFASRYFIHTLVQTKLLVYSIALVLMIAFCIGIKFNIFSGELCTKGISTTLFQTLSQL